MRDGVKAGLTSAETTTLWGSYINDSAIKCKFEHFLSKMEDIEIKPLMQHALDIANGNLKTLREILNKENYPIPYGFNTDHDVDISAPRLYSDVYVLNYLHNASQIALQGYSINLSFAVRADVYSYFNECITQQTNFLREVKELLLLKGLYIRSPYLPIPNNIEFIDNENFLTGFFGKKRPLVGPEITNLFANYQRNALGVSTLIGFSQVAQSEEVVKYLFRGIGIAKKHCEVFGDILKQDDLPVPTSWDSEVTNSTTFTFSDKLMMFYTTSLTALSVGFYGMSLATSPRRDIGLHYIRLSAEIMSFAEDGAKIMIKNGWLEKPQMAPNRKELAFKDFE